MHYHTIYQWLEDNNLWKDVLTFCVFGIMGWLVGFAPWRRHRKTQAAIADSLDTSTPGGLTALVDAIQNLAGESDDDEADSGSDGPGSRVRAVRAARQDGKH
jgi:hypothetical protein